MLGALTFLLIGSLLQGGLSGEFSVNVPPNIEVVKGSCVTIPCSFDVPAEFEQNLNSECRARWIKKDSRPLDNLTQAMTGDLTKKDCTSTFNNMTTMNSSQYYFRLECPNDLKFELRNNYVNLVVTDDPPAPNLNPSHLEVKEGSSVNLTCSAPAPCQTHPPTLTWTPNLGDVKEELQEDKDKTKVKMSVLTFTASHLHDGENISCTVIYKIQDGSEDASESRSLTAAVSFPPQILSSSDCTKTTDQINCSCRTVGNPLPILYWSLDGRPVSQSDKFVISSEHLNDGKGLRSFITVNEPQEMNCSTLICHSFNSLGFASQQFNLELQACAESHDQSLMILFISTTVLLFALVCVLLCVIRVLKNRQNSNSHFTGEINQTVKRQRLTTEVSNTTEEDIYVNTKDQPDANDPPTVSEPNGTTVPSSGPNIAEGVVKSSEKNEEESNVIYSTVSWKSKNKQGADSANTNPSGGSYLKEEKSMVGGVGGNSMSNELEMGNLCDEVRPRNVKKETECEYAQVKKKDKKQ